MVKSQLSEVVIPKCTIQDLVFGNIHKHGEAVALVDVSTGLSYTYKQLRQPSLNVASGLARLGVRQGDVVAILSPNSPDYVIVFYGILEIGATVTTINPANTPYEIENQLKDCSASYIYTISDLVHKVKDVAHHLNFVKKIICNGGVDGCVPFSQLLTDSGNALPTRIDIDPSEDTAIIAYSSGTTGLPKGVMLTHKAFVANVAQVMHPAVLNVARIKPPSGTSGHVVLGYLPFFHAYGIISYLCESLYSGSTIITMTHFAPELFLQSIEKFKVTVLYAVPPIVLFMVQSPLVSKYDLSSLRYLRCSAAPLHKETVTAFQQICPSAEISQAYGMTETLLAFHSTLTNQAPESVGQIIPNTEVKVIDHITAEELGPGQKGELCICGPQVMKGYLNKQEETKKVIDSEGWLHTGDVGYYDEKGNFYVVDRIKELIKVKGFQVPPAELESLLLTHPGVKDVAVVGVPDVRSGEVPRAYVVKATGSQVTAEDLQGFIEGKVANYKQLRGGVVFVDAIPKSPSGKILRRLLRNRQGNTQKSKL